MSLRQTEIQPSLSWTEIVAALVILGLVRALSETVRANFSSRLQLSVVCEIRGKVVEHVLRLAPLTLLRWPGGELASRVQVEVHGVRTLLRLGFAQGIRSVLVATALAIVALRVDTALAIPGLVVLPLAVAAITVGARPARRLQRELFRLPIDANAEGSPQATSVRTLELQALSFDCGDRPVLKGADTRFDAGEFLAVTGASGAGKSTLLGGVESFVMARPNGYDGVLLGTSLRRRSMQNRTPTY